MKVAAPGVVIARRCKCCRRFLSVARESQGFKTCDRHCERRWRRWQDPYESRLGTVIALGSPLIWNDAALQAKLNASREQVSERLLALARSRGWEVAWHRSGYLRVIGFVPPERRHLLRPEIRPAA